LIVQAQSYHLKDLVELGNLYYQESPYATSHTFDYNTLLEGLRRAMIVASHNIVVAEWDGEVVGGSYAYIAPYVWCPETRVNVELIYVKPEYRGRGLAEDMLEHQTSWARQAGATEITAGDIGLNPDVTDLWLESQGFTDTGVMLRKVLL
jgi:GNAT superfamily N-acetyltransferase